MTWIIRCAGCGAETDHLLTPTQPDGWDLDQETGRHTCPECMIGAEMKLRARVAELQEKLDLAQAAHAEAREGIRMLQSERDAMRHELAEMRAEIERERVRRRAAEDALNKAVSARARTSGGK